MRRSLLIVVWGGLGLLSLAPGGRAQSAGGADPNVGADLWSQFQIIVERNIFSRQRGRRREPERSVRDNRPRYVPTPESLIVLKGVVRDGDRIVAFFEDTGSGEVLRVGTGQAVARGRLEALTLDHVIFRQGEQTRIITVGRNLEGTYGTGNTGYGDGVLSPGVAPLPGASPTAAPASPAPSSAEESDILKKLMERRRQEMGG